MTTAPISRIAALLVPILLAACDRAPPPVAPAPTAKAAPLRAAETPAMFSAQRSSVHREGDDLSATHMSAGLTKHEPITLELGVTHDREFVQWVKLIHTAGANPETSLKNFRKDIVVELHNERGTLVTAWKFYRCWVSEYEGPLFNGKANDVAFERLKTVGLLDAGQGDTVRIEPRPYVQGHEILLGAHVVTGDDDPGVRYLYNVDVPAVIELARTVQQVPDLFETYVKSRGQVDLHDFLLALSTAVARGWLVSQ